MEEFDKVTHVIFDVDGLLLDTVDIIYECHNKTVNKFGHSITWDQMMALMGSSGLETMAAFRSHFNLTFTDEEYREIIDPFCIKLLPTCHLMPGAERLVKHLHSHGIPIAIASGGSQKFFDLKITKHKSLVPLFSHIVLASSDPDVKSGKPAPDVFLTCAKRFADVPDPKKCLVFEDAPNGVASARAAGMQVVLVPDERLSADLRKDATQILTSLEHFKPESFGLPPFARS